MTKTKNMAREEANDEKMKEEARAKNSTEPVPHRGEDANVEDVDPQHRSQAERSYHKQKGVSDKNNEDSRVDTDQGSHHGMGN